MQKRFVSLSCDERATLSSARHHYAQCQFRTRGQCLLLSADGHDVVALEQALALPLVVHAGLAHPRPRRVATHHPIQYVTQ